MQFDSSEAVRVLYVDDEDYWLDLVKAYLEREQNRFSVQGVTSAQAALDVLDPAVVDVVLSDFEMPVMSGLEFL